MRFLVDCPDVALALVMLTLTFLLGELYEYGSRKVRARRGLH